MNYGSMPIDDGHLILSNEDKNIFFKENISSKKFIRRYIGGDEFINNKIRWCLWLVNVSPSEIRNSPLIKERIELTRNFRLASNRKATVNLGSMPSLFGENRQPINDYIIIPKVSSENRVYIPTGIVDSATIVNGSALIIPDACLYHLGVLTSMMHMTWMKYVCGRMESRYQYSASIVYNNFPWPESPTEKQKETIEKAAQKVLDARTQFPNSSLADLYDPLTMPPVLVKAHQDLDKAVDLAYRPQPFPTEANRIEFLFNLYEKYTADLFSKEDPKNKKLRSNKHG